MQTIKTSVSVGDDRRLLMQLPENIPAGDYEVVLFLNQRTVKGDNGSSKRTTALSKARAALRKSVSPGHSIADELIEDRRKASERK